MFTHTYVHMLAIKIQTHSIVRISYTLLFAYFSFGFHHLMKIIAFAGIWLYYAPDVLKLIEHMIFVAKKQLRLKLKRIQVTAKSINIYVCHIKKSASSE